MLNRILRLVRQPINYFVLAGLLISSILPIQAQNNWGGTLRGYASGAGKGIGGVGAAVVGGVRYSSQWVYQQLESGAKNFPKWGRRRIANGLKRFATPSSQEKVAINKWIAGAKLTSEERALWRKFRRRALLYPCALAAIVTIILAIVVGGGYVRRKKEAKRLAEERQELRIRQEEAQAEGEEIAKLLRGAQKERKQRQEERLAEEQRRKKEERRARQRAAEAKLQEIRQKAIKQHPHSLGFILNNLQSNIFMVMSEEIVKRYNPLSNEDKRLLNQIMDRKEKSRLDRIMLIAVAQQRAAEQLKEEEEWTIIKEASKEEAPKQIITQWGEIKAAIDRYINAVNQNITKGAVTQFGEIDALRTFLQTLNAQNLTSAERMRIKSDLAKLTQSVMKLMQDISGEIVEPDYETLKRNFTNDLSKINTRIPQIKINITPDNLYEFIGLSSNQEGMKTDSDEIVKLIKSRVQQLQNEYSITFSDADWLSRQAEPILKESREKELFDAYLQGPDAVERLESRIEPEVGMEQIKYIKELIDLLANLENELQ